LSTDHTRTRQSKLLLTTLTGIAAALLPGFVTAASFGIPAGDDVVGRLDVVSTHYEDTIPDIAYLKSMGFREMKLANPNVDTWMPGEGTELVVPSFYVLPPFPREGIVVNVPEMRLYFYPKANKGEPLLVHTYPIGVGREDWVTPHAVTKITAKTKDPAWYPPESIRREHAAEGDILPTVVKAGPDNPLGQYAMRLGLQSYLIHGTNNPYGIGMRVTHGCIRLTPRDVEDLFQRVQVGTPVRIVNEPVKVGVAGGRIYLEAHPRFEEDQLDFDAQFTPVVDRLLAALKGRKARVDWNRVRAVLVNPDGIPVVIGEVSAEALAAGTP
jgi:L,D-transpeptidase ErfK/SrfK